MAKMKTAVNSKPKKPDWPANRPKNWPLGKIEPYARNPRTHPPAQIALLASIFKKHGIDQPIVVDDAGVILKGHGRRLAAIEAGLAEFPVVQRFGLSDEEKTAMRIEDNQVALLAGWDQELIRGEVAVLRTAGYELALLGFGEAQLVHFTTTPGPPAEFPAFGEDIEIDHQCPRCGYVGSGDWTPKKPEEPAPAAKNGKKR